MSVDFKSIIDQAKNREQARFDKQDVERQDQDKIRLAGANASVQWMRDNVLPAVAKAKAAMAQAGMPPFSEEYFDNEKSMHPVATVKLWATGENRVTLAGTKEKPQSEVVVFEIDGDTFRWAHALPLQAPGRWSEQIAIDEVNAAEEVVAKGLAVITDTYLRSLRRFKS